MWQISCSSCSKEYSHVETVFQKSGTTKIHSFGQSIHLSVQYRPTTHWQAHSHPMCATISKIWVLLLYSSPKGQYMTLRPRTADPTFTYNDILWLFRRSQHGAVVTTYKIYAHISSVSGAPLLGSMQIYKSGVVGCVV